MGRWACDGAERVRQMTGIQCVCCRCFELLTTSYIICTARAAGADPPEEICCMATPVASSVRNRIA